MILSVAFKYLFNSSFTLGKRIKSPIMFGNTNASIMASENAQTEDISPAAPITIKIRNKDLYVKSDILLFPKTNIQD